MFTILLTIRIIRREVGKLTKKPIRKALNHLSQKYESNPAFISVRTRDMTKDIPMDTKVPNKIV